MGPKQILPLQVRVDMGVMVMKMYNPLPRAGVSPSVRV